MLLLVVLASVEWLTTVFVMVTFGVGSGIFFKKLIIP